MRKQTKKVLSWVLAGAMALSLIPSVGLVSEKADAAVSTVDKVVFDKAVESKLVGGDSGEARLLVFNNWGKYDPNALEGISMKDASITFNVEGVADVLAKTGAKSIKAFLGLNSSDWSVNTLGNTAPADGVTEIEKDGTYTVTYTGSSTITLGNQMGVMFADIDSALEKDDDKNVTAGLKVSDTKLQLKAPALMKDVTSFDKAVESKLVGGDSGEARLLVFNNWGKYDPSELEGIDVKNASITFKVAGVADVLAKTGAKSIKAFLGLNSSDWSVNTLGNTVPANGVTEIEKDGTYTVTYTGSSTVKLGNQMGVMFADIDSALEKDDDKNVTAGLTVSDASLKVEVAKEVKSVAKFDGATESKFVGGDSGEARLLVFNNWGKFDPNTMEGQTLRDISISFKAAGVADVLAKTGAKSIKAFIGVNSSDWSVNTLGNTVPSAGVVEIEKDGTYTVSYTAAGEITLGNQLGVMFADIDSALEKDDDKNVTAGLTISDVTMKTTELKFADDTEGPEVTPTPEPTDAPKAYDEALWATKGIHAYLSYQMDSWDYRNGYKPNAVGKQDTYDYIKASGDATKFKATDVLLTRDGEYTVAISGIDLSSATKYNLLSIATDLSAKTEENPDGAYADVKLSVTSLKVDGAEVAKDLSLVQKADELYYYYPLINKWSSDDKGPLFEKTDAEDLAIPENSIEITFKVTGLKAALNDLKEGTYKDPETCENVKNDTITKDDIDASEGALPTPSEQPTVKPSEKPNVTPAPTNSPAPTKAPTKAPKAPKKGNKVESGKVVYKVTKAATAKKAGTLAIVGLSKAGKKASSLSAPATAKINGYSYKVTSIGKNAFKGANAKTISLGKNIKSIPAGAFANCKKLSTLKVKAKLTKVAKKAFKGCKKTIKVKGASKKVTKANVKKLKKSGYKKFK